MSLMQSPPGPWTLIDGRRYLYFVGTGYLGLQGRPEVIRAACAAAEQYGIGSATNRGGFGATPPLVEVERRAAALLGAEDAFYFSTGYAGCGILLGALAGTFDTLVVDELSHYCVLDAAQAAGCPVQRFAHCSVDDLRESLDAYCTSGTRPIVMTDGVFAARGTIAPLADYLQLLDEYPGAALLVDDAHGLGVLGASGRGTLEHAGVESREINSQCPAAGEGPGARVYACATLSKAAGGFGGVIAGSGRFIEHVKTRSPWYRGASTPPAPIAAASARGLELMTAEPELRLRLSENVGRLKAGLRGLGLEVDDSPVPIVCLTLGTAPRMQQIQQELQQRGILVAYMPSYAGLGPEGALRLAVFANHDGPMIDQLLDALRQIL